MATEKEIVVSGIRPTGYLHLGNYFGAIRNYIRMQEEFDCYFFVADWHSLTTHPNPKDLQANVMRVLAENIASGLDPEKVTLYAQSHVPEIAELYLLMNMLAYKGELEKVPTFKDKVRLQPENVNAGLLTYPVLMSVDILIQRAVKVPVGKDQGQHLEMARNFAQRFNNRYGNLFPEPVAFNYGDNLVRILSLDGKGGKMSKSENEMSTLYLSDSDEQIRQKLKKAKTDSGSGVPGEPMPESVANLIEIMKLVSTPDTVQFYTDAFNAGSIRYGDMKTQLGEDMVKFIAPIREKAKDLQENRDYLHKIMKEGAEKARANAAQTLRQARNLMGLNYFE